MPHCIIEYSDNCKNNIDIKLLLSELNKILENSALFKPNKIKLRAISYSEYFIPEIYDNFIHLKLYLLSGRSDAQKKLLAQQLQTALTNSCNMEKISITTAISEIDRETYQQ